MRNLFLSLVIILGIVENTNAQLTGKMTKASVDLTEKTSEYDKYSGNYEGTAEQEQARLKAMVIRDMAKYKKPLSQAAIDLITIPLDEKFENDGVLQFWWVQNMYVTREGVTTLYHVKKLYIKDKLRNTINPEVRFISSVKKIN